MKLTINVQIKKAFAQFDLLCFSLLLNAQTNSIIKLITGKDSKKYVSNQSLTVTGSLLTLGGARSILMDVGPYIIKIPASKTLMGITTHRYG